MSRLAVPVCINISGLGDTGAIIVGYAIKMERRSNSNPQNNPQIKLEGKALLGLLGWFLK